MTEYQTFVSAVSQLPAGMARWWIEEVLVRGTPEGGISGAHVIIGAELTDPLGGKSQTQKGPYPLDALNVLSGQPAADWQAVLGQAIQQQQATIVDRDATITGLNQQITNLQQQLADAQAASAAKDATIGGLTQQLAAAQQPQP